MSSSKQGSKTKKSSTNVEPSTPSPTPNTPVASTPRSPKDDNAMNLEGETDQKDQKGQKGQKGQKTKTKVKVISTASGVVASASSEDRLQSNIHHDEGKIPSMSSAVYQEEKEEKEEQRTMTNTEVIPVLSDDQRAQEKSEKVEERPTLAMSPVVEKEDGRTSDSSQADGEMSSMMSASSIPAIPINPTVTQPQPQPSIPAYDGNPSLPRGYPQDYPSALTMPPSIPVPPPLAIPNSTLTPNVSPYPTPRSGGIPEMQGMQGMQGMAQPYSLPMNAPAGYRVPINPVYPPTTIRFSVNADSNCRDIFLVVQDIPLEIARDGAEILNLDGKRLYAWRMMKVDNRYWSKSLTVIARDRTPQLIPQHGVYSDSSMY